jgi:hypothetical protein
MACFFAGASTAFAFCSDLCFIDLPLWMKVRRFSKHPGGRFDSDNL